MGSLKSFFSNVFDEQTAAPTATRPSSGTSSFEALTEEQLEQHLAVSQYGDFTLTDAIRPSFDLKVVPKRGYRRDIYTDTESHSTVPVLMGSASREQIFEVFVELVEQLGATVDVVLETSHERDRSRAEDELYREHMDVPVLKSILYDFEELLTHDGCTGIAILNPNGPHEVQFDEHKLLICYSQELHRFENVFEAHRIQPDDQLRFITEAEHVHSSCDKYVREFEQLKTALGMDGR